MFPLCGPNPNVYRNLSINSSINVEMQSAEASDDFVKITTPTNEVRLQQLGHDCNETNLAIIK
jgi:hypothetical protein